MYHIYISHAEKDRMAAQELTFKLRRYKLPKKTEKSQDKDPLVIDNELFSEQEGVKNYLIVVCSFNSVNSSSIRDEVIRFLERESYTHIIPYVIGGIPYAKDPKNECIPEILKTGVEQELLAVNRLELGKQRALCRIISTVYGIGLDKLLKRAERQEKRRRIRIWTLCVFLFGVILYSDYTVTARTEYYRSIEYINNAPRGIDRVYFWERLFVKDYYEFWINYKNVLSVKRIGDPQPYHAADEAVDQYYQTIDAPYIQFTYHTDGTMDASVHYDEEGNLMYVLNYVSGMAAVDFSAKPDGIMCYYLFPDGQQNGYSRALLTYDEEGYLVEIKYVKNSRNGQE